MKQTLFLLISLLTMHLHGNAQTTYLHCGRLIDCNNPNELEVATEMTIIVEDGKIKAVEKGYLNATDGQTIDLKDKTVLPGLMDMHVHIEGESNPRRYIERFTLNDADVALRATVYARRTLMAGFTTVRDLGGTGVNVSLRNAINQGFVDGPRIFTAEKAIATTGGHADPTNGVRDELKEDPGPKEGVVNSPEDARKAVRQRYKNGADCIKITATGGVLSVAKDGMGPQFKDDELDAIISTADDYGLHTAAHAHGAEGMKRAVLAGISSIEHGTFMTAEIIDLMKEKGTYYVPTIAAGKFVVEKAKQPGYFPSIIVPKALAVGPQIQETFAKAYKGGVKIAFGTDSGVSPHGENGKEFLYMVEAGMTPSDAILSATVNAADLLRQTEVLGSISAGKFADIIAVEGQPEQTIEDILKIKFVMKNGEIYKNED